jgi:hypothetical protein
MFFKSTDIIFFEKARFVISSRGRILKSEFCFTNSRILINKKMSWLRNKKRGEKLEGGFHRYRGYEELEAEAEAMENLTLLISSGLKSVLSWRTCRT